MTFQCFLIYLESALGLSSEAINPYKRLQKVRLGDWKMLHENHSSVAGHWNVSNWA